MATFNLASVFTLDTLILGLIMGGIYALISMGLSIQYGVAKILNISHGEFIIVGACLTWTLVQFGINPVLALIICSPFMLGIGYLVHRTLFERLKKVSGSSAIFESNAMLLAFGMLFIILDSARNIWGSMELGYAFLRTSLTIGGTNFAANRVFVFVLAVVIATLFYLFLQKTRLGKSIRAAAQDPVAASLMGINIKNVMAICFGIGAMLAGMAGTLLSMIFSTYTSAGMRYAIIAIIVVVLGGLGSIPGSVIGGFILGLVGTIVTTIEPSLTLVAFYFIIMALLLVRPKGLMGR